MAEECISVALIENTRIVGQGEQRRRPHDDSIDTAIFDHQWPAAHGRYAERRALALGKRRWIAPKPIAQIDDREGPVGAGARAGSARRTERPRQATQVQVLCVAY